jgi:hypothetical protein
MQVATETQIKCTDLRIGNLVYSERKNIVRIDSVCEWGKRPLFGIPLTPEILEKAGFNYKVLDQYKNEYFYYHLGGLLVRRYDKAIMSTDIKYIHQLQNLYHSLIGNELEIPL